MKWVIIIEIWYKCYKGAMWSRVPVLLCVLFALLCPTAPWAQVQFPPLTGRVVDGAGLLPSDLERRLAEQLQAHEEATTNQVVVVTVPGLQGLSIEQYGRALGNHWGIGQKDKDNGVLLLVAPNDRKVRIEVGKGLTSELSDRVAQDIVDRQILPQFRGGDFEFGVQQGVAGILAALGGRYDASGGGRESASRGDGGGDGGKSWWKTLLGWILAPFLLIGRLFGLGRSGGSSSGGGFSGGGGSFGGGGASGSW